MGDISRTARQRRFLMAIMRELASPKAALALREIWDMVTEYTDTDITMKELSAMGWRLRRMDEATLRTATLPGHFKGAYWEPDYVEISNLMASLGLPTGQ